MATARVRYVDTASSGGDGTTRNHSGPTAAYASVEDALTDEKTADSDLVTGDEILQIFCAGSTVDNLTTAFDTLLNGWTTGASNYIDIIGDDAAPDNDGAYTGDDDWSTSHYRVQLVGSSYNNIFEVCRFRNIQVDLDVNTAGWTFHSGSSNSQITGCRIRLPNRYEQLDLQGGTTGIIIENNIITADPGMTGFKSMLQVRSGVTLARLNNNLFDGSNVTSTAINHPGTITDFYNNVFHEVDNDLYGAGTIINSGNNASDNFGTDPEINVDLGTATDAFTDPANGVFTVKDTDSNLYDAGNAAQAPALDIRGLTRDGLTDIGPFELVSAPPPPSGGVIGRRRRHLLGVR